MGVSGCRDELCTLGVGPIVCQVCGASNLASRRPPGRLPRSPDRRVGGCRRKGSSYLRVPASDDCESCSEMAGGCGAVAPQRRRRRRCGASVRSLCSPLRFRRSTSSKCRRSEPCDGRRRCRGRDAAAVGGRTVRRQPGAGRRTDRRCHSRTQAGHCSRARRLRTRRNLAAGAWRPVDRRRRSRQRPGCRSVEGLGELPAMRSSPPTHRSCWATRPSTAGPRKCASE